MPRNKSLNLALIAALFGLAACHTSKAPTPVAVPEAPKPVVETPAPEATTSTQATVTAPAGETKKLTKKEARAAKKAAAKAAKLAAAAPAAKAETGAPAPTTTAPAAAPAPAAPTPPAAKSNAITQDQALALGRKGNCLACHKIDAKLVGPAWKDVAAKYKGDTTTIAANIKKGGKFGWNMGVMPPKGGSSLSDADIASLAGFIATLK